MRKKKIIALVCVGILLFSLVGCASLRGEKKEKEEVKSAPQPSASTRLITVEVQADSYHILNNFKRRLKSVSGIKDIYQKKFKAHQKSELHVSYAGTMENLADRLAEMSFSSFTIEILGFTQDSINVRMIPTSSE